MRRALLALAVGCSVLTPTLAAQVTTPPTNPGQFTRRPGDGRQPEFPPPTITEYHPRSTLKVPEHLVPRAKFPAVDFHGHPPRLTSPDVVNGVGEAMDKLNVQVMINASANASNSIAPQLAAIAASKYPNRFVIFTSLNLSNVGPGSGARIAAQLEADIKAGAVGLGEIMKGFGMSTRKADGTRLHMDDPELDVVWETAARLKIPVFIHVGDPAEFFEPLDFNNERWLEQALYADRRYQDRTRYPAFEELMAERDRMFKKHPNTIWVLAHLGWHAQDLSRLGKLFDELPNLYSEVGAVLYDLGRQPRAASKFLIKYQDRVLFGKDSFQPDEYPYYWRVFETEDEYFDYYRDYHAFWKMYGLGLPDVVLKKLYYGNALKLVPALAKAGLPK